MSKSSSKKKGKTKGNSIKKWKGIKNDIDGFWLQNLTTTGQSSPKMSNKLNITAPINFTHLGVNQIYNTKWVKENTVKMNIGKIELLIKLIILHISNIRSNLVVNTASI